MTDARWLDVADDVDSVVHHFHMAVRIFELGNLDGEDLGGYRNRMAFLQAMQSGYTSLAGDWNGSWTFSAKRADGQRLSSCLGSKGVAIRSWKTPGDPRWRHRCRIGRDPTLSARCAQNDNGFDVTEAVKAVEAARTLSLGIARAVDAFKDTVDPMDD